MYVPEQCSSAFLSERSTVGFGLFYCINIFLPFGTGSACFGLSECTADSFNVTFQVQITRGSVNECAGLKVQKQC